MLPRLALAVLPLTALLLAAAPARSEPAPEPPAATTPATATEAEPPPRPQERVLVVRPGDTLARLLDSAGIDATEVHGAVAALTPLFRPTDLRPGVEIGIRLSADETPALLEVEIEPQPGRTVRVLRQDDRSWRAEESLAPRSRFIVRAAGTVDGGLFPAMTNAGLPPGLALSLIRVLGHQVDFQRDLQPGDRFTILFERYRDGDGDILGHGQVLHAELTLSGRVLAVWRHKDRRGTLDWYDAEGRSLRRTFLRTPLDGARVTSRFGMRSHPILGFTRMHQGVDFGAPTGTPVYAAADGVVVSAKNEGGYGRMVRLRHSGGVETRYAHLSRFGRGIAPGRRVRQGDVIGAVGSTGMSTGPHLHYEVIAGGRPVNPSRHIQQTTRLAGQDLAAFRTAQRQLRQLTARLGTREEVAMASD